MDKFDAVEYGAGTLATCLIDFHINRPPFQDWAIQMERPQVDYAEYIQSERWKALADHMKGLADNKCQLCDKYGRLNVHHKTYKRLGRYGEIDDLIVLCQDCHKKFHGVDDV